MLTFFIDAFWTKNKGKCDFCKCDDKYGKLKQKLGPYYHTIEGPSNLNNNLKMISCAKIYSQYSPSIFVKKQQNLSINATEKTSAKVRGALITGGKY